jgi:putative hemolysin
VNLLEEFGPYFLAMVVLAAASGCSSCSEAALFSLQSDDRRALRTGGRTQRLAIQLLSRPERLLTAILFWNLLFNIAYFALASVIGIQLESEARHTEAGIFSLGALLALIVFGEMTPKIVGVLWPRTMASLVSVPLALAVRTFEPIGPLFAVVIRALRRLLFPHFRVEPYLELSDLEQAITISTSDEELATQERLALQNIVQLSDLRADELMRPRTQFQFFSPPVHLEDLKGRLTRSGYLLVTEQESDEVAGAIALKYLPTIPRHHLEHFAQPVVYVPWCSSVAAVFDELQTSKREVAAIINELGETIGIITLEDLLYTVFEDQASRSAHLLMVSPIQPVGDNLWRVTGMTSLRRLGRTFGVELPPTKSKTVAGLVQEQLQRLPVKGDTARWQEFEFYVAEADNLGRLTVELQRIAPEEEPS